MTSTALEGQLDIVAWPGYIERGESDKAYDWVTKFEADTGCKVNVKIANTSDEMVTLMTSGGPPPSPPGDASWPPAGNAPYDLVTASGDASLRLIRGGTVQPIGARAHPELLHASIRACRKPRGTTSTANTTACPTSGARTCCMYNTKTFKTPADFLVGGVRGAEAARRQVQQGPRAGLRRAYLHRRRGAVPRGEEPRARHQGSRTSSTRCSTPRCSRCCAASIR